MGSLLDHQGGAGVSEIVEAGFVVHSRRLERWLEMSPAKVGPPKELATFAEEYVFSIVTFEMASKDLAEELRNLDKTP
jgi:hypothetical protein